MPNQTEQKTKMIGPDMILNMTNKDRAQATNQTINRFILALVIGASVCAGTILAIFAWTGAGL
jgi:hypothetical protein